ncbi:MAG: hypothetical protein Q8O67_28195 [Deltaproteobacteria bacterium]|nr:hypothetical protein [Deltaproteobacteria bacterium]
MHLLVYDATGHGKAKVQPFLTTSWKVGSSLYRHHPSKVDDVYGATSWEDALAWLCSVRPRERIDSVQYWGHGLFGRVLVGDDVLDITALQPEHARHHDLIALRQRVRSEETLFWFRTCATFGRPRGQAFARAWTRFFGCRAAGHTFVIGPLQSGLHSLRSGDEPSWPVTEGVPASHHDKLDDPGIALASSLFAPHTITCLQGSIPAGW